MEDASWLALVAGLVVVVVAVYWSRSGAGRDGGSGGAAAVLSHGTVSFRTGQAGNEKASDLLRNSHSGTILVASAPGRVARPLGEVCPALAEIRARGSTLSAAVRAEVEAALGTALAREWSGEALPDGVAALAIDLLAVSPQIDCLLAAEVMPPAMQQPSYTLVLAPAARQVRCLADGFVGAPVLGPADPALKYTATHMRTLSGDLVRAALERAPAVNVAYCLHATRAVAAAELREAGRAALNSALAATRADAADARFADLLMS